MNLAKQMQQGLAYHRQGQLDQAKPIYQKVLRSKPAHVEANHLLGMIAYHDGDFSTALQHVQKAVSLGARQPHILNNLGEIFRSLKRYNEAISVFQKALSLNPNFTEAHYNLGLVYQELLRPIDAIRHFDKVLSLAPSADIYCQLANCYTTQEQPSNAIAYLQAALLLEPRRITALCELGRLYALLNDYPNAFQCYQQVLVIAPDHSATHKNVAIAYKQMGQFDKAREHYHCAISGNPPLPESYRELAAITKYTEVNNDIQIMQNLVVSNTVTDAQRLEICFGLAKAFDDLHDYNTAFHYLELGNRLKRKNLPYSRERTHELFTHIQQAFIHDFINQHTNSGLDDDTPIFILGMPRSGTTLVEQILSSHPHVYGAGELMDLVNMTNNLISADGIHIFPDHIGILDRPTLRQLGEHYLSSLRRRDAQSRYVTDKMPSNFLRIGFIKLILPKAKIIHCRRHPVDNALSIYKRYFTGNQNYAYDLAEIADYYQHYHKLMQHWRNVLPDPFYEIQYEELVADQDNQTRKLLDYCKLPWDDACLSFHETTRKVATASVAQVREPIYRTSVDAWQHYEKYLEPLMCLRELR